MQDIITWPYILRRGHSDDPSKGACAMDAVNWLVHGKHGDAPECACPVIASYVTKGNDGMPDDVRQRLLPYLHRISGSRSPTHQAARIRVLQLGALRVFAPRALDAAGLHDHASKLRALPDDVDMKKAAEAARAAGEAALAGAEATRATAAQAAAAVMAARAAAAATAEAAGAARAATTAWAAQAAAAAWAEAARAEAADDFFTVLDQALNAGPQGEPWSADIVTLGESMFVAAGGRAEHV